MAGRKDALRRCSSFKSRGHHLVALVPPLNASSDIDSGSEPENKVEIAIHRREDLSSSSCPSIHSDIERMDILDSSENHTQDNISIDSDKTNVDANTFKEALNEDLQIDDRPSVNGNEKNSVLEFSDNLNHERPPLTPVINNVLPPTGEINYNAIPSLASLLSIPSSNASSMAIHFVDNTNSDEDRYYKIRPFIEKIRRNCLATEEETKYSIDEMTIYRPSAPQGTYMPNFSFLCLIVSAVACRSVTQGFYILRYTDKIPTNQITGRLNYNYVLPK